MPASIESGCWGRWLGLSGKEAAATYRSLQGWVTTLPAGTDVLMIRRIP
jgi:hypothetical protein